jgi:hypothetical protein
MRLIGRWRLLFVLAALLVLPAPFLLASESDRSDIIRQWIDSGVERFLSTGEITQETPPDILLEELLDFAEDKSEEFQNQLEDTFIASLKEWYPRFYHTPLGSESKSSIALDEYLEEFRWVSEVVERKEQRFFGRNDSTAIYRIGLKVAFISRFGTKAWDDFKGKFRSLWHPARDQASPDAAALEAALFGSLGVAYKDFLNDSGLAQSDVENVNLEIQAQEFIDEVKVFGDVLLKHDVNVTLFSSALQLSHMLIHARVKKVSMRSLLQDETFAHMLNEVKLDYNTRSALAVKKFLETAELGKFRERKGAFSRIRLAAVKSSGQYHLLYRADVKGAKASLVVINPPHRLQKSSLTYDDPKLVRYVRKSKTNALLIDLSKSGVRPKEKFSIQARAVMIRPGLLDPKRIAGEYFLWAYEHPTWGQAFLASGSLLINGGLRVLALHEAARLHPEMVHWNTWAVSLALGYYFGCALFKRWYDNALGSDNLVYETAKKAVFSMFFTTAAFVWLTQDVSLVTAVILTLPLNVVDKLLSSLSQRLIRTAEREGIVRGDFVLYANDLNPLQWGRQNHAQAENLVRSHRNVLRSRVADLSAKGVSSESINQILVGLRVDLPSRLNLLHHTSGPRERVSAQTVDSEDELIPEEFGILAEDLKELETNIAASYERELDRFREDGHLVPPPMRSGPQLTPRLENGLFVREIDGGGRNLALSVATTVSHSLGTAIQVAYGLASLVAEVALLSHNIRKYKREGNDEQVRYYKRKLENVVPFVPTLLFKAKESCRSVLTWLARK